MGPHLIGIAIGFVLGIVFARKQPPLPTAQVTRRLGAAATTAKGTVTSAKQTVTSAVGRGTPLEEMTRDELYERAKEIDLPGRSEMTKEELVEALRRAGRSN